MADERTRTMSAWVAALHFWAAWGFAVVQPLFDLLSRNATFLLFHRVSLPEVWLLVALLALIPFLIFYGWERLVRRVSETLAERTRWLLLGLLLALAAMPLVKRAEHVPGVLQLPLALLLALAAVVVYARLEGLRWAAGLAALAVPIFAGGLLSAEQVRGLVPPSASRGAAAETPGEIPIIVVVFDGLPLATLLDSELAIDRQLFPNFARLTDNAHWFRNASTVSVHTVGALPALLTGSMPRDHATPTLAHYGDNLFTLLDGRYRIAAKEPITRLSPVPVKRGSGWARAAALAQDLSIVYQHIVYPDAWTERLPPVDKTWGGFAELQPLVAAAGPMRGSDGRFALADQRGPAFERWVDSLAGENDSLYFHHVVLPHFPYRYLPAGRVYGVGHSMEAVRDAATGALDTWWIDGETLAGRQYMRHMVQAQYADTLLGALLDRLTELGLDERALLVVAADHGDSFWGDGALRTNMLDLTHPDDVLRVPLMVRLPGQTARVVDDRNVDLRDVLPTLADVLSVDVPWPVEGHSLFAEGFPHRARKVLLDRSGREITFGAEFAPDLETQARKNSYFPPDVAHRRLYRYGPLPELIGRSLDELELRPGDFEVDVLQAPQLAAVDPESRLWPVRLSGSLRWDAAPAEMVLALALHGRIEATTRIKFRQGRSLFSVFVAEQAVRGGSNPLTAILFEPGSAEEGLVAGEIGTD